MGPYASRDDAQLALADHVACLLLQRDDVAGMGRWRGQGATPFEAMVAETMPCRREHRQRSESSAYAWTYRRLSALREDGIDDENSRVRSWVLEYLLSDGKS
jgi:hypothetical protein